MGKGSKGLSLFDSREFPPRGESHFKTSHSSQSLESSRLTGNDPFSGAYKWYLMKLYSFFVHPTHPVFSRVKSVCAKCHQDDEEVYR